MGASKISMKRYSILNNLDKILRNMINAFIENHKLSQIAHEEIMSMTHYDKEIAEFFQENEMAMTKNISNVLLKKLSKQLEIEMYLTKLNILSVKPFRGSNEKNHYTINYLIINSLSFLI